MTSVPPTDNDRAVGRPTVWVVLLIVVLLVVALIALAVLTSRTTPTNELPKRFGYSLQSLMKVDPRLVAYHQTGSFPVHLKTPRAIAVGPDDEILVAGDQSLFAFDSQGKLTSRLELDDAPQCLAVDADGTRYLGFQNRVLVYDIGGKRLAEWPLADEQAIFTSIAWDDQNVFVADAGNKCVIRYDRSGKIVGRLAQYDPKQDVPQLVIPSPYFDVAVGSDGLLRVVNPGSHQIEMFTPDGRYEAPLTWGTSSNNKIESFCGCCNPVAIALMADDRVVTAEKGIPRVKIYSRDGHFECVVATPEQLGVTTVRAEETRQQHKLPAVDLAIDGRQRIFVLDPAAQSVRVFEKKDPHSR